MFYIKWLDQFWAIKCFLCDVYFMGYEVYKHCRRKYLWVSHFFCAIVATFMLKWSHKENILLSNYIKFKWPWANTDFFVIPVCKGNVISNTSPTTCIFYNWLAHPTKNTHLEILGPAVYSSCGGYHCSHFWHTVHNWWNLKGILNKLCVWNDIQKHVLYYMLIRMLSLCSILMQVSCCLCTFLN